MALLLRDKMCKSHPLLIMVLNILFHLLWKKGAKNWNDMEHGLPVCPAEPSILKMKTP